LSTNPAGRKKSLKFPPNLQEYLTSEGLGGEHIFFRRRSNVNVQDNVPGVHYEWPRPYLAAALETDSQLLPGKISEARRIIRARQSEGAAVGAAEQSVLADAWNALTALEAERLNLDAGTENRPILLLDLDDAGSEPSAA
jgi:hypothetical protein